MKPHHGKGKSQDLVNKFQESSMRAGVRLGMNNFIYMLTTMSRKTGLRTGLRETSPRRFSYSHAGI
jgi:hypothetical protein